MSAPYGPKTLPRKLLCRPLGRIGNDSGVKMRLELEMVGLAKSLKKQLSFCGFHCLEGVWEQGNRQEKYFWALNCNPNKRVGGLEDPMIGD